MRLIALIKAGNEKGEQKVNDLVEILNLDHPLSTLELQQFNIVEVEDSVVDSYKISIANYFTANSDGWIIRHYYEDGIIKINGR